MTVLTDAEHGRLAALLTEAAGLSFYGQRREALAHGVRARLSAVDCPSIDRYLRLVGDDPAELQALLDEVTVQETQFFRNPPQIRALRRHVLPEVVRRATADGSRRIRVWSAGCSTGEEPYTVAMLLRELVPPASPGWDITVLATDISSRAVEAARRAVYGARSLRLTDDADRDRWMTPAPDDASAYAVRDEVRELVDVRHHNVVTDAPPCDPGELDLVLCRNVTIYLTREATRALVQRLHGCLRDGGYLFLGHAETLWQVSDDFALVPLGDAFVYRRIDAPTPERRQVIADRRTAQEPWPYPERRVRQTRRPPGPRERLDAARAAVAEGSYAHAADLALEVATAHPLEPAAHYLRGLALATAGADEEAVVSLRKAAYLDPGHGLAHFVLGGALERLGHGAAAALSYRTAARALAARRPVEWADELGGREPAELADLSLRLARRAETTEVSAAPPGSRTVQT